MCPRAVPPRRSESALPPRSPDRLAARNSEPRARVRQRREEDDERTWKPPCALLTSAVQDSNGRTQQYWRLAGKIEHRRSLCAPPERERWECGSDYGLSFTDRE